MEEILDFLVNNYLWFLIISLILIFALIGYIVDSYEKKAPKLHFQKDEDVNMNISEVTPEKSLKELIEENEDIVDVVNRDVEQIVAPVNPDNKLNIDDSNKENELQE